MSHDTHRKPLKHVGWYRYRHRRRMAGCFGGLGLHHADRVRLAPGRRNPHRRQRLHDHPVRRRADDCRLLRHQAHPEQGLSRPQGLNTGPRSPLEHLHISRTSRHCGVLLLFLYMRPNKKDLLQSMWWAMRDLNLRPRHYQ